MSEINFEETLPVTPTVQPKTWVIAKPKFQKQCVKSGHFGKNQTRIIFPKALIEATNLDDSFNAYYILYKHEDKLILILSKNIVVDADFKRAINPIGIGLFYTVVPPKLLKWLGISQFPDYIWLNNTEFSTEEDIVLQIEPA